MAWVRVETENREKERLKFFSGGKMGWDLLKQLRIRKREEFKMNNTSLVLVLDG